MMAGKYLTPKDRRLIARLYGAEARVLDIANKIGCHPATIYEEQRRGDTGRPDDHQRRESDPEPAQRAVQETTSKKPTVRYAYLALTPCLPQRWDPVQVLEQYHLDQYYWIRSGSTHLVVTVPRQPLVPPFHIQYLLYFPQQMSFWHQRLKVCYYYFPRASFCHLSILYTFPFFAAFLPS